MHYLVLESTTPKCFSEDEINLECSDFSQDGYKCVPENRCGGKKVAQDGLEVSAAFEAICPNEEDTCCTESNIIRTYPEDIMCSAIDGYTCASPTNCRQGF